jgi:dual specificity phosphatase 12
MEPRGIVGPTLTDSWDACCVAPSLWVGAASAVCLPCLQALRVTHVLSVMRGAPCPPAAARVLHLAIDALDIETEFLLDTHIPAALAFIQAALDADGCVLVHCQHGHSRSVAVAAAFLMRSRSISASAALHIIDSVRRTDVNPAFQVQLLMLELSAFSPPTGHFSAHSRWRFARLQSYIFASRGAHCNPTADLQPFSAPELPEDPCDPALKRTLRCSSCSKVIALQGNVAS